jgi:fermentation-respiration switch protein FrsA (DUF1100 family)
MTTVLAVVIATYVGLVSYLWLVQRKLLYKADRTRPDPAACGVPEMRIIALAADDGLKLSAWYRPAAAAGAPVMLYFHGNDAHLGARADKVRPYLDAGFGVLLLSYRGYGGNPGRPTEQGLYRDARAALAFLRAEGVAAADMVYYGESLGSGVAVQLALEAAPAALVLEAPFTDIAAVAQRRYPFVPVRLLMRDRFDNLAKIPGVRSPVLVIHGERDRTTPVDLGRAVHAAAPEPKEGRFYPHAAHVDLYDHGAADDVLRFIAAHHPGGRGAAMVDSSSPLGEEGRGEW